MRNRRQLFLIIISLLVTNCMGIINTYSQAIKFDSIVGLIESEQTWLNSLKRIEPQFDLTKFKLIKIDDFIYEFKAFNFFNTAWMGIYKDFVFYSPDNMKFVDIYSTRVSFVTKNGEKQALFDVDTKVFLVDLSTHKTQLVTFSGPTENFNDCFWLNANMFLLVGISEVDYDETTKFKPFIKVYDLSENKMYFYQYSSCIGSLNEKYFTYKYKIKIM